MKQIQWTILICLYTWVGSSLIDKRQQAMEAVARSFCLVSTTLNEEIVQVLLEVDIEQDGTALRSLVHSMVCAAKMIHLQLQRTIGTTEELSRTMDQEIVDLVHSTSNLEKEAHQTEQTLAEAQILLTNAQNQVIMLSLIHI